MLRLASLLEELPPERVRLLDNLGRLRREVGPITPELSDALADRMNLRHGDVHGLAADRAGIWLADNTGGRLYRLRP